MTQHFVSYVAFIRTGIRARIAESDLSGVETIFGLMIDSVMLGWDGNISGSLYPGIWFKIQICELESWLLARK